MNQAMKYPTIDKFETQKAQFGSLAIGTFILIPWTNKRYVVLKKITESTAWVFDNMGCNDFIDSPAGSVPGDLIVDWIWNYKKLMVDNQ